MLNIDNKIKVKNGLLLAPMEDVTNLAFRRLCKELGADIVYTEFVNSEGLIRNNKKTKEKLLIEDFERPIGIQIYGENTESMIKAAKLAEEANPDLIDINAGCWVKKVCNRGAGAGLLRDPIYMQKMAEEIVKAVNLPVTVKTRIGWDESNFVILEVAKRLEDVGVKALTVHCRTRVQGHSGDADYSWIPKIKEVVSIPVIVNGGIFTAEDVFNVFNNYNPDGVMIARGAINHPWIFKEAKEIMETGKISTIVNPELRIQTALKHLRYELELKEEKRAVIPFRKYYSGYLKGLHNSSKIRQEIMKHETYEGVEKVLLGFLDEINDLEINSI
ncbi:MAG: tRNA dihydrouridine synthase DusB [bacterium]